MLWWVRIEDCAAKFFGLQLFLIRLKAVGGSCKTTYEQRVAAVAHTGASALLDKRAQGRDTIVTPQEEVSFSQVPSYKLI